LNSTQNIRRVMSFDWIEDWELGRGRGWDVQDCERKYSTVAST